jgi:glycerate 2-kinase
MRTATRKVCGLRVVFAPDDFKGVLSARGAAEAMAAGWARRRPDDELVLLPASDGGDGLLEVLGRDDDTWLELEVAGPHGHPLEAPLLLRADGTAVVESATACGLHLVPEERRSPMPATTWGVGQLVDAARRQGAARVLVGLGGSASVDGGTGALGGLGFRLRVEDGSGLKIGAHDLHRVRRAQRTWAATWDDIEVVLLADTDATLDEAAALYGPQKGATSEQVEVLTTALATWAEVAERDLADGRRLREVPGAGAAGGLGFGLAAGLGARLVPGAAEVARLLGLDDAVATSDLVVTGEGHLDATSGRGKLVSHVLALGASCDRPVAAVVGVADPGAAGGLAGVEEASPTGPGPHPEQDVADAAARLAARPTWP